MSKDLEEGVTDAFLPKKEEEGVVDGSATDEGQGKGESVPLFNDGSTSATSQQAIDVDTGDLYIEKWVGVQMSACTYAYVWYLTIRVIISNWCWMDNIHWILVSSTSTPASSFVVL